MAAFESTVSARTECPPLPETASKTCARSSPMSIPPAADRPPSRQSKPPCGVHRMLTHIERPAQLRPVGLGSARHFAEHFFGSGGGQRCNLRLDALAVRRYPCIAVDHAHILHVYSAQENEFDVSGLGFVQNS